MHDDWVGTSIGGLPYFFLSYARSDDDEYVDRFFGDLCAEVRVRAGLARTADVGFFDVRSIDIGKPWSVELIRALGVCSTFLALCSPRYFVSDPCGREWQLFADRERRYEQDTGERSSSLIPVLWLPLRALPEPMGRLQYHKKGMGEAYRVGGLRQLIRLHRFHDEYLEVVELLAERIVENARRQPPVPILGGEAPDFEDVPNAFADWSAGPAGASDAGGWRCGMSYADHVRFIVAAPARREAGAVRRNVEFYDEDPVEWMPYRPSMCQSLARFAKEVAARRGLTAEISAVVNSEATASARPSSGLPSSGEGIVILLVDAWAPQLDEYRRALINHEIQPCPAVTAMVPRNHDDHETSDNWRRLSEGLRDVFHRRMAAGEAVSYRPDILSHRAFDEDLQMVLEVARNRLFTQVREPHPRTGETESHPSRPILQGP